MKLSEIASLFNVSLNIEADVAGVSIDSRTITPGQLFVAVKGERFDGHDFIARAAQQGAVAAIVSKDVDAALPIIKVTDTIAALAKLAEYHRAHFNLPVIALTGSCGKTTVKSMIAAILQEYGSTFASPGNFNNHIGVPLSILKLQASHRAAVFELGANHPGEIAYTVNLVKPNVALITNVGPAHLEGFGSLDGVMRAKSEIYHGLAADGVAIYNADDDYASQWRELLQNKTTMTFGLQHAATITAREIVYDQKVHPSFQLITAAGAITVTLQVAGQHNVLNALAATAATLAINIPLTTIKQGLEKFQSVPGRLATKIGLAGATIIDDSYNANLKSVLAALEVLAKLPGQRILVLGDMGELGDAAAEHHRLIGEKARQLGIDNLFTCGTLSRFTSEAFAAIHHHYADQASLIQQVIPLLANTTTVVVKGSLSSHMGRVVAALTQT